MEFWWQREGKETLTGVRQARHTAQCWVELFATVPGTQSPANTQVVSGGGIKFSGKGLHSDKQGWSDENPHLGGGSEAQRG